MMQYVYVAWNTIYRLSLIFFLVKFSKDVLQNGQILAIPTKYLTIQQEHVGSEKCVVFFLREQIKLKIQLKING